MIITATFCPFSVLIPSCAAKPLVTVHRKVAEDAMTVNIFLSADPLESEADMKGKKKKLYLKLSGFKLGLLLNFNVTLMREGIVRIVNELEE